MQNETTLTSLHALLSAAEMMAKEYHDGHVTLMRFTTGWKAVFGTPALDRSPDESCDYNQLFKRPSFETMEEALRHLIELGPRGGALPA